MLEFIQSQILFYLSLVLVLFLPGYLILKAIFGKSKSIETLEKFIVAFGLSIVSVDFLFFFYSKVNIRINRLSVFLGLLILTLASFLIYKFRKFSSEEKESSLFNFSRKEFILLLLLLFLTIFIKTAYLSGSVLPTATDMGHHMYWVNWLKDTGKLPTYQDVADPATFIIGEHIPFAAISILSGASVFSAFPFVVLLLVNFLSILAVFILALRIFENKKIALLTLLFLGALYAVSSPQAKFVSGGVIGNIFGNFLVPLMFYFYYRAFSAIGGSAYGGELDDKYSKIFLSLAVFLTFGLFYTHHLTAFIFLFVFLLFVILFALINYKEIEKIFPKVLHVVFSPWVIGTFVLGLVFFFFVFTPTYVTGTAVDTAVGAPSKATRIGLTFKNLRSTVGEARIALGLLGLLILAFNYKRKNFGYAIIAAWAGMIYIMSSYPHLLFINLPSSRVGNYLTYPVAILSAYAFYVIFKQAKISYLLKLAFLAILAFVFVGGVSDSVSAFKTKSSINELVQTFSASAYLAKHTTLEDKILKDHNYLTADAWMKVFFLRGYRYPDSRGLFGRYSDETKPREMCTLNMISNPGSVEALQCFIDSGTDFVVVNPKFDGGQFRKLNNFNQVYTGSDAAVFYKNN